MAKRSAGLLVYRTGGTGGLEVLLVHPGGPYWASRDDGAWSIPKGEHAEGDDPLACARREFEEELGQPVPRGPQIDLGEARQPGGKVVRCLAVAGDLDVSTVASNEFEVEWPPRSGRTRRFPEVDRAGWFGLAEAGRKLLRGQVVFLDRLRDALDDARER